ncbi:MAG: sterol desaturase [Sphingobacteriales bacterium 40-81]|nr:MAG: sterol desaturase [Sphingobacteriales bacterium 40-81]
MSSVKNTTVNITRDAVTSIFIYALPVVLMFVYFKITGQQPWNRAAGETLPFKAPAPVENVFKNLRTWGLPLLTLIWGIIEFSAGLYKNKWNKNEAMLDIVCFAAPKLVFRPLLVYVTLLVFPYVLPGQQNAFSWVPFWWACLIIAVADDLTQYWYHRLHHQVPWLWRFHRTHHSADYMGMAMAGRQNFIYTIFFSQIYLTSALTYLGLGYAALFVGGVKSVITLSAHSSIPWDKPFYKYKLLHPLAWILECTISTPATHHAHHADSMDDGIGYYKGNFGNMFFIWDIIFGTAKITRQYPTSYGIRHYKEEEWYAQFLWPIFKSKKEGSELSADGPMVADLEPSNNTEAVTQIKVVPQG